MNTSSLEDISITAVSENCVCLSFDDPQSFHPENTPVDSEPKTLRVHDVYGILRTVQTELHVIDLVPAYNNILIYFDFLCISHSELIHGIKNILIENDSAHSNQQQNITHSAIEIPTYYDSEVASELSRVAYLNKLPTSEIIAMHSAQPYSVCAIGFLPGFAFLGFLPKSISTPRINTPRACTPKGSVGIADNQTGVYPAESPGGWNIIGRTPIDMLTIRPNGPNCIVKVGDKVRFTPISRDDYLDLGGTL